MKTNFIIEEYTNIDMLIVGSMLCIINNDYLDLAYLRNKTFHKLLSDDSKQIVCKWLKRYNMDITSTEDPLDFVMYMQKIMLSDDYVQVRDELTQITRNLIHESKQKGVPVDNLYYVVRYYYNVNIEGRAFSQFDNTCLQPLASVNVSFQDMLITSGLREILPNLLAYNNLNYKILSQVLQAFEKQRKINALEIQTTLNVLMLYYVVTACKEKPKRITWSDIIKYLYSEQGIASSEVFSLCYLED